MGKVLWEIAKVGGSIIVAAILLALAGGGSEGSYTQTKPRGQARYSGGQGGSVWTVGSGGKKPGSWSSGRHK